MNVGIITRNRAHNFGAVLQAYALSEVVRRLGHDCRIIDYNPDPNTYNSIFLRSLHPSATCANIVALSHWRVCLRSMARFNDFITQQLPLTPHCYSNGADLCAKPHPFDAVICGSDQIWRPKQLAAGFGAPYFLDFTPDRCRRIAYAASFGVSSLDPLDRRRMAPLLARIEHLSVREPSGQDIVRAASGREAAHVLDPTLLLPAEAYAGIEACPARFAKYLLLYPMQSPKGSRQLELVQALKQRLGLPVVYVFPKWYSRHWGSVADQVVWDAGPREFLGLIKNAGMVCTSSFHGTAFSIIYRRPFINIPHSVSGDRARGLLTALGLAHRQAADPDALHATPAELGTIDYAAAGSRLDVLVEHSMAFLRQALGDADGGR
jgi:hypothetical protein